jgi:hypothetical protein
MDPDFGEIAKQINQMVESANRLREVGKDIPAVDRNMVRVLASLKMLEINIGEVFELSRPLE